MLHICSAVPGMEIPLSRHLSGYIPRGPYSCPEVRLSPKMVPLLLPFDLGPGVGVVGVGTAPHRPCSCTVSDRYRPCGAGGRRGGGLEGWRAGGLEGWRLAGIVSD